MLMKLTTGDYTKDVNKIKVSPILVIFICFKARDRNNLRKDINLFNIPTIDIINLTFFVSLISLRNEDDGTFYSNKIREKYIIK